MPTAENPPVANGPVRVRIAAEPYLTSIQAGTHEFLADEPGDLGGADQGPSPYDLLLGSLGACKAITATMYAQRKGWPLTGVALTLTHTRLPDHQRLDVAIAFEGDLTDEQRSRLLDIAGKCPVEKTLTGDLRVRVTPA